MIILRKTKLFAKVLPRQITKQGDHIIRAANKSLENRKEQIEKELNTNIHKRFEALKKEMGL